jgi:hypothetical protein
MPIGNPQQNIVARDNIKLHLSPKFWQGRPKSVYISLKQDTNVRRRGGLHQRRQLTCKLMAIAYGPFVSGRLIVPKMQFFYKLNIPTFTQFAFL